MEDGKRKNWTIDETIIALYLYHQIPFGKIYARNPIIKDFATMIHRTPAALVMKIGNLARFDPLLQQRGVNGLTNGSKLDKQVWESYADQYSKLVQDYEAVINKGYVIAEQPVQTVKELETQYEVTEKEATIQVRIGQNFFRNSVISAYEGRCCMTGINVPELLTACHIKPWSSSTDKDERLNPQNGLCMNELFHKAFDTGLITVGAGDYLIHVSDALKNRRDLDETTRNWIVAADGQKILLPHRDRPDKVFLEYHNDVIFRHG